MIALRYFIAATLIVGMGLTSSAWAEAKMVKGSGQGMYQVTELDRMKLANGTTLRQTRQKGFVTGNEPDNPFNMTLQDCTAYEVLAADGSMMLTKGHCSGIDRDGDVWLIWFDAGANTWGYLGGTGKFKGIEGGGTTKLEHVWPDGRYALSWEGTWQTK